MLSGPFKAGLWSCRTFDASVTDIPAPWPTSSSMSWWTILRPQPESKLKARIAWRRHPKYCAFKTRPGTPDVGTSFVAPEIKRCEKTERPCHNIPAHLWGAGNLSRYLLGRCDEPKSTALEMLGSISHLLLCDNDKKWARADETLALLNTQSRDIAPSSPLDVADV
jgi:hypothetical protein